jgi:hypothetical protein
MEPTKETIDQLHEQEQILCEQIACLEERVAASSTPGIREFRKTRLRQLQGLHRELSGRLSRLKTSTKPAVDAYMLGTALRDAKLVVESTFFEPSPLG